MATTSPFPAFQALLEEMQKHSEQIDKYLEGDGEQPPWMVPPLRDWDGDPLNIESIKGAFARDEPNEDYATALNNEGTSGEVMGLKTQIDYMGMMERSFRARCMTSARAALHSAGRLKGHGDAGGVHVGSVLQYVQDLLRSGSAE